ncbi:hypothetical protein GCM10010112_35180 [Actinoplanes lobatus]|uniref:Putative Zn-binding protein involved in type VI secretion n=1 Tax=Actinoplanes lobatus TaxID=113568 RepID=A0A7W7MF94_9ACTN|nr:WD40 repeat domain-containing protein [Actinoplanes lobatus]MBB4748084.1 putative Zn-binding protein involved in type VI secretion [Actinoplanes lobatus]GGN69544.1 hypothetical protein GCM10010112_35180 [Actinoplanes lobatus]GIE45770.1 hypothetical protein Alo02nite_86680 [Actinoplanes lobatus]
MGTRRIGAAAIAVLTGTAGLTIGTAAPASADSGQLLSIKSIGDILVDGVHERVFVSDPDTGKVVATDYSGTELGSALVNDASHLALSVDSSQLYVTSPKGRAILALDTTDLTQTAEYSTGSVSPKDVAIAGGRIWFSYSNGIPGYLGTIDPATETPTLLLDRFATGWTGVAELATASAAPNRLGVASYGMTAILEVSGDTATTVGSVLTNQDVIDMAISPDGDQIATAYPGDNGIRVRDADDLTAVRMLRNDLRPVAVDIAADGSIAGGVSSYYDGFDGYVFAADGTLIKEFSLPDLGQMARHAVAWEPNGHRLFTVSTNGSNALVLRTWTNAKQAPSILIPDGPDEQIVPGGAVTVTGTLTSPVALPSGTSIEVVRSGTPMGAVPVAADGTFTFTDIPAIDGALTYTLSYAGDVYHAPKSETVTAWIARARSNLTLSGPSTAVPGAPITITGTLLSSISVPVPTGASVSVLRAGASLGAATVAADGSFSITDTPPGEGTWAYEVSYAGTSTHLPATATASVTVSRTASTLTLSGPTSATRAKPLTITGKLNSPVAPSTGTKVSVSRVDLEHTSGISLGTKAVSAGGSFSFTDTPTAGGTVTYRVSFAGDATHTAASASKSVAVSRTTPALTLNNNGKIYSYGQTVSFTARLGSTYKNRVVEIWADPDGGDQARRLIKRGTVSSSGYVTASIKLSRNTTVTAVFAGDARTAPRTVTATVGTKVSLSLRLSQYYKTKKVSGVTYRYYRTSGSAWVHTSMTGAAERKVYVQLQRYTKGKWQTWDGRYFDATDQLYLEGAGLAGVKLRVRTAYVKGGSGDSLNSTTWTSFQYFTFTQ